MEQAQESNATDELPRCQAVPKISQKLKSLIDALYGQFNGESETHKVSVVISFEGSVPRPSKEDRKNIFDYVKANHPRTFQYLEGNRIESVPLGFSSGDLVAYPTLKQLDDLRDLEEIRGIDCATSDFQSYQRILIKKF